MSRRTFRPPRESATPDRLATSRSRLGRIRTAAMMESLVHAAKSQRLLTTGQPDANAVVQACIEAEQGFYAKGVADAMALLLDADHPAEALSEILGLVR